MSTKSKSKPKATEKDVERDLAAHARLPEETKELMKLKDREEKTSGREQAGTTRKIENKARKSRT